MHGSPHESRRTFLRRAASAGVAAAVAPPAVSVASPSSAPPIRKVAVLRVPGAFYRPSAMNAYDDGPKGKTGSVRLVRLVLADGTTGVGVEGYARIDEKTVKGLRQRVLGADPLAMYAWKDGRIQGVADANNGYRDRPDAGVRLLRETAPDALYWMEELLPETKERYRRLRRTLTEAGVRIRLAEGENAMWADGAALGKPEDLTPWFENHLIDVAQPDLRTVGWTNLLAMVNVAAEHGKAVVPTTGRASWASSWASTPPSSAGRSASWRTTASPGPGRSVSSPRRSDVGVASGFRTRHHGQGRGRPCPCHPC